MGYPTYGPAPAPLESADSIIVLGREDAGDGFVFRGIHAFLNTASGRATARTFGDTMAQVDPYGRVITAVLLPLGVAGQDRLAEPTEYLILLDRLDRLAEPSKKPGDQAENLIVPMSKGGIVATENRKTFTGDD